MTTLSSETEPNGTSLASNNNSTTFLLAKATKLLRKWKRKSSPSSSSSVNSPYCEKVAPNRTALSSSSARDTAAVQDHDSSLFRIENPLLIEDIKQEMTNWISKVIVQEKSQITHSSKNKTTYQKFVFVDSKGSKVQGIMFNQAISVMGPKLELHKKYLISNAEVRKIPEKYQYDGIDMQWVISTKTVLEELLDEEDDPLPVEFNYTAFNDLAQFADSKTQTVDVLGVVIDALSVFPVKKENRTSYVQRFVMINEEMQPTMLSLWNSFTENEARTLTQQVNKFPVIICRKLKVISYNGIGLSTKSDSIILIDPPKREAKQLKIWAIRNEKNFVELINNKEYVKQSPKMFYQQHQKLTLVADAIAALKTTWVKVVFSFEHIFQKYWYMACSNCYHATSASYLFQFTCNHCNEKQQAEPRCRFDIDLIDESGTITASIFAELGENLLGVTATEAMEHYNLGKELPLEKVHDELKTKLFIAQIKPAKSRDSDSHQRYTLNNYFEYVEDENSLQKITVDSSNQNTIILAETQPTDVDTSVKEGISSTVRVCPSKRFEEKENTDESESENDEEFNKKKAKVI